MYGPLLKKQNTILSHVGGRGTPQGSVFVGLITIECTIKYMVICGTKDEVGVLMFKGHSDVWFAIIGYKQCGISCYRLSLMA
jgi:hypothetical protein